MDLDDYQIQAKQMMQPLPGYSSAEWSKIKPEEKKRLIIADMKKQEKGPDPFKNPVADNAELVGKNQKGKTVVREKTSMGSLFDKADAMQKSKE